MPPSELPRVIDGPLAVIGDLHGAAGLLEWLLGRLRRTARFDGHRGGCPSGRPVPDDGPVL